MNKKLPFKPVLMLTLLLTLFFSCDLLTDSNDNKEDTLYVKFTNDSTSTHTITVIQLSPMGEAGDSETVQDTVWGENILQDGETITPGEHKFFTLDIPNLHYSIYRLGVLDGNGNTIMIDEQPGYTEDNVFIFTPTITHWGSDERDVSVTITVNPTNGIIYIKGYSDFAGIE